jgi:hypothetical protein
VTPILYNLQQLYRSRQQAEEQNQGTSSEVVYWSIDSADGTVQGPLDLGFMKGKVLHLTLAAGQIALQIRKGKLQTIFLEGVHARRVGNMTGDLEPNSELLFLALDRPFAFAWRGQDAIWLTDDQGDQYEMKISGEGACQIKGPEAFYAAFLRNAEHTGEPFAQRVIAALVRSQIEKKVNAEFDGSVQELTTLASNLGTLTPADINPLLSEFGLSCTMLSVQISSSSPTPAGQTTGQSADTRVNRSQ